MAFKSKITPNIGVSGSASTLTPTITSGQTATIVGLSIANTTTGLITVSAQVVKNSVTAFMIKNAEIPPGNALVIVGGEQKVVLEAGDQITAYASLANSTDAKLSYLI